MERIRNLNLYQKIVLIVMAAMAVLFFILYSGTIARVGYEYNKVIFVPSQEGENIVYDGKLKGKQASFTVTSNQTVLFQHGDTTYGPYMVKEDPTILVENLDFNAEDMKRIEIYRGDESIFRGGVLEHGGSYVIYNEDGSMDYSHFISYSSNGIVLDGDGNEVDPIEPSIFNIVELIYGPDLVHKGEWYIWIMGVFVCGITAFSILYADELFRFKLSFRINDVDHAEPSDWEMMGRYITWTVCPLLAFAVFISGLCTVFN